MYLTYLTYIFYLTIWSWARLWENGCKDAVRMDTSYLLERTSAYIQLMQSTHAPPLSQSKFTLWWQLNIFVRKDEHIQTANVKHSLMPRTCLNQRILHKDDNYLLLCFNDDTAQKCWQKKTDGRIYLTNYATKNIMNTSACDISEYIRRKWIEPTLFTLQM